MKICHVCNAQCDDSVELCPLCGADLNIDNEATSTETATSEIAEPVLLASVEDIVTAEILKDVLLSNGIVFTSGKTDAESTMRVMFGGGFIAEEIYVGAADLDKAKELYTQVLECETQFDDEFDFVEETEEI